MDKMKTSDFCLTHQSTEVAGQTVTPKYGETGMLRGVQLRLAYLEQKLLEP